MTYPDPRLVRGRLAARCVGAIATAVALLWLSVAGAQDLHVIELRYRLADDIIPALQPLLEPGGVITGMDAMLFVRTSPANLEQLRQVVAALDRKPRQLRVTVGQGTVTSDAGTAVHGSATIGGGDVQVGANRPPGSESGVAVQARQRTQRADLRNVSSITTLEGSETFISIGQSVPLTTTQAAPGWAGPNVVQTTEYRDVSSGFYATPRINGEIVILDVSPRQQRLDGHAANPRVESAGVSTQVSGRLGEWIRVGGSSEASRGDTSGLLVWGTHSGDAAYSVWVMVEEVP